MGQQGELAREDRLRLFTKRLGTLCLQENTLQILHSPLKSGRVLKNFI